MDSKKHPLKIAFSPFAKAYKPKVSLLENLKFYKDNVKFLPQLTALFPFNTKKAVKNNFIRMEYSRLICNMVMGFCSKNNTLPQGAPSSPYLYNRFFNAADILISDYCKKRKNRDTRYANDLSLSANFNETEILEKVTAILTYLNLNLNRNKTKLMTPNTRECLSGIVVNDKPQVVFHKGNDLRQALYFILKFGFQEHKRHQKIKQKYYWEHLNKFRLSV